MSQCASSVGHRWRARVVLALVLCALAACAGKRGEDRVDSEAPPGGTGTGAGGVPIFWTVLGYGSVTGTILAVQQTADGGFVGAGLQEWDVLVVKTDARGAVQWQRRIAVPSGGQGRAIRELAGGGYVVAGVANVTQTEVPFLLRLASDGATVAGWPKYRSGARGAAYAVHSLGGGADGFLAAGYRDAGAGHATNVWVVRTDAAGATLWERSDYADFCPGGGEGATALAPTGDGDFVLAGTTGCFGWSSFLMRIAASDGAEAWRHAYDPAPETAEAATAVAAIPGGGFYVAGWHASNGPATFGQSDALVLRTDAAGNETWRRLHGGAEADAFDAVVATTDGGFVAVGFTRSYGGAIEDPGQAFQWEDVLLVRGDAAGESAWRKVKGLKPRGSDVANAVVPAADGGFVIGGTCGGNALVARFDGNGDTVSLGASDLTYAIPAHEGILRLGTAVDAAAAAVAGLTRPRQVGGTVLDLVVAALRGEPAGAFCTGGGSYGFDPALAPPLVAPAAFTFSLDGCVFGPEGDRVRLDGTASVAIEAAGGDVLTADYTLAATVGDLSIQALSTGTSDTSTFEGSLRIARTGSGAGLAEVARSVVSPAPGPLVLATSEGSRSRRVWVGPFTVSDTVAPAGAVAYGAAGDAATVDAGTGPLEVTVLAAIERAGPEAPPSAGAFEVRAPDGSRVTVTVGADGVASLEVDTDGDGTVDGVLQASWDDLD